MTKLIRDCGLLATSMSMALLFTSCNTSAEKKAKSAPVPQAQAPTLVAQAQPKPKPAAAPVQVAPPSAPQPDPVDKLIEQAEKEFQQGQQDYSAGHLESAKQNFDDAVNTLLEGPVEVRSDERLQRELDKITEGVNQLEVVALQQGDGFTEQKAEPAPIDEANEVTFPADPNVKAKAEAQLKETQSDLPLVINDYVAGYINFFSTRGHATLERALVRSGRYRDMILRVFKEEGVPQDLIYLAEAESGFEPLALSRAGARGMWQFMSSRASGYGLQRSWWIDERQDPEKSTRAAARHLKDLYNQFGDWYLAMAAYNSGPGNVQQAVKRTGYADFWELYKRNVLPKETKNYVPIILAYTIMAKNPAQYGLSDLEPALPIETDTVKVDYPVDLRLVAECVDTDLTTLTQLNPSLLRLTTPKDAVYDLRLPAGTKDKYLEAINAIPVDKRVAWRYHHVAAGETLESVARHYHASPRAIEEVNNLSSGKLQAESKLIIPVTAGRASTSAAAYSRRPTRYKVRRGDTVMSVADDFGVPAARLRRWNGLKGNELHSGKMLVIYRPVMPAGDAVINSPKTHSRRRHTKSTAHQKTTSHSSPKLDRASASKSQAATHSAAKAHSSKAEHPTASGTAERTAAALQ